MTNARTLIMVGGPPERSANDTAWSVVGRSGDTSIDALSVQGTTDHGYVVLQITVEATAEVGPATVRCYSYTFTHRTNDTTPTKVACKQQPVVVLTTPVPLPVLDSPAQVAKLTVLLRALSPEQRRDPSLVQPLLVHAFPPPASVYAQLDPNGTLEVGARTYQTCLSATASAAGLVTVVPAHGANCRGG
ncbi:MAG: hypothetical protein ABI429_00830 [Jatrophihabitantaceae bacterium]